MCGISGEVRFDGEAPDVEAVERMTRALAPRGPDGHGTWARGPVALGHRRLSIIDLSPRGAQPMADDELGCVVMGIAPSIEDGLRLAAAGGFDVALLDVNLNGRRSDPIAETLARAGTPYVYATGYGAAAVESDTAATVLQKPYTMGQLAEALTKVSGAAPA